MPARVEVGGGGGSRALGRVQVYIVLSEIFSKNKFFNLSIAIIILETLKF